MKRTSKYSMRPSALVNTGTGGDFAPSYEAAPPLPAGGRMHVLGVGEMALIEVPFDRARINLQQPRRELPRAWAERVNSGDVTLTEAMQGWAAEVGFDVIAFAVRLPRRAGEPASAHGQDADATRASVQPPQAVFEEIADLAEDIFHRGLIQLPTVVMLPDGTYQIESGERRTLAVALLAACGRPRYAALPAIQVPADLDHLGRQIAENHRRKNFTAIQYAQALVSLRMVRSGRLPPDWGARAPRAIPDDAEGLVPWTAIEREVGISDRYRRFCISLLTMPPQAIALAEELKLAEFTLRPLMVELRGNPDGMVAALQRIKDERADTTVNSQVVKLAALEARREGGVGSNPAVKAGKEPSLVKVERAGRAIVKLSRVLGQGEVARAAQTLAGDKAVVAAARALLPVIQRLARGGKK